MDPSVCAAERLLVCWFDKWYGDQGKRFLFKHMGKCEDVNMSQFQLCGVLPDIGVAARPYDVSWMSCLFLKHSFVLIRVSVLCSLGSTCSSAS